MPVPVAPEDAARAAAVTAHIVRHTADALRLLQPRELVICYQEQPAIRRVIDLAIDQISYTLSEHAVQLDAWRAAAAIDEVLK